MVALISNLMGEVESWWNSALTTGIAITGLVRGVSDVMELEELQCVNLRGFGARFVGALSLIVPTDGCFWERFLPAPLAPPLAPRTGGGTN